MDTNERGASGRSKAPARRAKIVATLGPTSSSEDVFRQLVRAGLDVARLNFSHGSHQQKQELIDMVRKIASEESKPICILADLQGPKIRTGILVNHEPVMLEAGKLLTITPEQIEGTASRVSTVFTTLAENLKTGDQVLLSDGLIELRVVELQGADVVCEIINGGKLGEKKGINLPGVSIKVPSLTPKDEEDLEFALQAGVDMVAVSFVQTADDVRYVKTRIAALGSNARVIAKLEKPQAVDQLDPILDAADGIMVARGDLGVEVPPEQVPAIQKHIIRRAAEYRKPVITATQMLESMIDNPRPTRAEASDVANAVYDGTDAVMLSAESAAGKYPVEAVAMMNKIILATEAHMRDEGKRGPEIGKLRSLTVPETICECMAHSAQDLNLAAIAIFSESGNTVRLLSKYRPDAPIYALSPDPQVVFRSNLLWGTYPIHCKRFKDTDQLVALAESILQEGNYVNPQDIVGIVAGTATRTGATNFMRLHVIGDL